MVIFSIFSQEKKVWNIFCQTVSVFNLNREKKLKSGEKSLNQEEKKSKDQEKKGKIFNYSFTANN